MDRHLLGLKMIAAENGMPLPKLFHLEAYQQLTHFLLSTSQGKPVIFLIMKLIRILSAYKTYSTDGYFFNYLKKLNF